MKISCHYLLRVILFMNPISGITFGLYHALCITPPPSIKLGLQNVLTMIWCEYDVIHLHTDTQADTDVSGTCTRTESK